MSDRAQFENAIVFACDEGHLPFAFFAALRILELEPDGKFDVVICMPDTSGVEADLRGHGVRFCQINIEDLPSVHMPKEWISSAAFYRYLLPTHFRDEYGCLMYLDTDTYLRRAGIDRLFASIEGPVALAAAYDTPVYGKVSKKGADRFAQKVNDLGGGTGYYFNSGVWISQPEEFARIDGWKRFCRAAETCQRTFPQYLDTDQDAMNLALAKDILPLSPLFNWFAQAWLHEREIARYDPYILHFTGPNKPWRQNDDAFVSTYHDDYIAGLRRYFPNFVPHSVKNSLPWRREHPKYALLPANLISDWRYQRRTQRRMKAHQDANLDTKFERMDYAIATAKVGQI